MSDNGRGVRVPLELHAIAARPLEVCLQPLRLDGTMPPLGACYQFLPNGLEKPRARRRSETVRSYQMGDPILLIGLDPTRVNTGRGMSNHSCMLVRSKMCPVYSFSLPRAREATPQQGMRQSIAVCTSLICTFRYSSLSTYRSR